MHSTREARCGRRLILQCRCALRAAVLSPPGCPHPCSSRSSQANFHSISVCSASASSTWAASKSAASATWTRCRRVSDAWLAMLICLACYDSSRGLLSSKRGLGTVREGESWLLAGSDGIGVRPRPVRCLHLPCLTLPCPTRPVSACRRVALQRGVRAHPRPDQHRDPGAADGHPRVPLPHLAGEICGQDWRVVGMGAAGPTDVWPGLPNCAVVAAQWKRLQPLRCVDVSPCPLPLSSPPRCVSLPLPPSTPAGVPRQGRPVSHGLVAAGGTGDPAGKYVAWLATVAAAAAALAAMAAWLLGQHRRSCRQAAAPGLLLLLSVPPVGICTSVPSWHAVACLPIDRAAAPAPATCWLACSWCRLTVSTCVAAVQESFDPIMDLGSNTDLLPVMLYARRAGEWDYSNCLTLLLRHKASGSCIAGLLGFGRGSGAAANCLTLLLRHTASAGWSAWGRAESCAACPRWANSLRCPPRTPQRLHPARAHLSPTHPLVSYPWPLLCRASRWWPPSAACLAHRWRSCR